VIHAELQQRTLRRLDESTTAPVAVTLLEVTQALNEGQRLFAAISLSIERTQRFDLIANQAWYQVSEQIEDWFVPLRCMGRPVNSGVSTFDTPLFDAVLFDELAANSNPPSRVRPARLADLDAIDQEWQNARSDTTLRYGMMGFDTMFIYPAPLSSGVTMDITYAAVPRDLSGDYAEPDIPVQFHQNLIEYAVTTLRLTDGGTEFGRTAPLLGKFMEAAQRCADLVRARSKTLQYDRHPFELRAFDRSRLIVDPNVSKDKKKTPKNPKDAAA
jgi:hypothetical protein